ncbi:hypothetical protein [Pseudolysinimonas kribbensis]|uniref:hypothetical protein n=1 Tax=Pseudolysinimonas kribbensis TaxID=433641 RepID=UPI003D671B6C
MASPGRPEEPEPIDHEGAAARESMNRRAHFVEISIQQAMRRREFDDLPGAGKPSGCATRTIRTGGSAARSSANA